MLRHIIRRALNLPGWEKAPRRLPNLGQIRRIRSILTLRERALVVLAVASLLAASSMTAGRFYLQRTDVVPADGGSIVIGVIGRPLYPNPVLAASNPADSDLVRLTYAGLFRYDKDGKLIPDLAESIAIGDFGKIVEVKLKDGVRWPDGEPLLADDVVFTVNAIKNPDIRSPLFVSWTGIGVEVVDARTVRFLLPSPYPPFPHNLTVGILPKHIWENIPTENFGLAEPNLKPVGLGPFIARSYERTRKGEILSYTLEPNTSSPIKPHLRRVTLRFFDERTEAIAAFNRREIDVVTLSGPNERAAIRSGAKLLSSGLPHTFALFLNQTTAKPLTEKPVREALARATDRGPILALLGGELFAAPLERPIPEGIFGATADTATYPFDPARAQELLESNGWQRGEDGMRAKKNELLTLTLTVRDEPTFRAMADSIRDSWRAIGVAADVRALTPADYRKAIAERNYEVLLAGQELPLDPDLFAFWHSSQKFDPGGNVALYANKDTDKILEDARADFDETSRAQRYAEAQKKIMEDIPAIFLWQDRSVIATDARMRGADARFLANASWRLGQAAEWYVQTKRIWKERG